MAIRQYERIRLDTIAHEIAHLAVIGEFNVCYKLVEMFPHIRTPHYIALMKAEAVKYHNYWWEAEIARGESKPVDETWGLFTMWIFQPAQ